MVKKQVTGRMTCVLAITPTSPESTLHFILASHPPPPFLTPFFPKIVSLETDISKDGLQHTALLHCLKQKSIPQFTKEISTTKILSYVKCPYWLHIAFRHQRFPLGTSQM